MENLNKKLTNYQRSNIESSLLSYLEENLKDENFNLLVSKLDMSKEKLCKYTSTLEECSKEYANCKNCKGLAMCKNKVNGYAYLPKKIEDKLEFNYKPCKYQNKLLKEQEYLKNVYNYNIPKELKEAQMKNIYTDHIERIETIKWLKDFIKNYPKNNHIKGLYLNGSFGSGKTYLISAMFNELAKSNIKSAIVFWPDFLNNLKSSFGSDNDAFKKEFNYIKNVPLLLIDDIGAENSTPWARDDILCPILQYRMQESLPTFFTSNLSLKNLESHFSFSKNGVEEVKARRIMERIKQLTDYQELIGKNLRN